MVVAGHIHAELVIVEERSTPTYLLADVPSQMEGEAKQIVKEILIQSLEVNEINERGADAANLFNLWYNAGELRNRLRCIKPRALFRERELADIEDAIEDLARNWRGVGAMILQEETERLQDEFAWVEDPENYMDRYERN